MKKKVTYSDIAQYTNYSKMTISRYFNNPDSLTDETKEKIENALKELNYQSNKVAKILANGKSEFIGIIIPELFFDYYSLILNDILTTYSEFNYKFLVFAGNHDPQLEKKYIQELLAYQVEGLIILSYSLTSKVLQEYQFPIVTIEREDQHISSVNTNNYLGGQLATNHLIDNKCDVVIHINGFVKEYNPSYQRINGFKDTSISRNVPYEIIQKDFINDYDQTYQQLLDIYTYLEKKFPNQKKGVFVSNDNHANIFLNILLKNHKKIPEEYEIVGFDNTISKQSILPITTVSQNTKEIAYNAIKLLNKSIKSKNTNSKIQHLLVDPQLIIRETTLNQ